MKLKPFKSIYTSSLEKYRTEGAGLSTQLTKACLEHYYNRPLKIRNTVRLVDKDQIKIINTLVDTD